MARQKLNIIIPVYNEERRFRKTLTSLKNELNKLNDLDVMVYVVNDGSSDSTLDILKDTNLSNLEILGYKSNMGKGYALKYGVVNSRKADLYILADADLSTEWDFINNFIKILNDNKVDIVIASRAVSGSEVRTAFYKKYLGRISSFIINLVLGLNFRDTQCGYKLFNIKALDIFSQTKLNRWGIDFEALYYAKRFNLKVLEIPVKWTNTKGSKVKLTDYIRTFFELLIIKFSS